MRTLDRIRRWAETCPDRPAYCWEGQSLTYGGLWDRALRLSQALLGRQEPRVLLWGGKAPDMVVGMLGCLLAGKTYVPAAPDAPAQRLAQIRAAAAPCLLLTDGDAVRDPALPTVAELRSAPPSGAASGPDQTLPAYIMFTSGTTGAPKGVPISRENLDHFVGWITGLAALRLPAPARVMNQAGFHFDLSVADLYYSLCGGHTLCALPRSAASDPAGIFRFLRDNAIQAAVSTPTFLKLCLLEPAFRAEALPALEVLYACGERLETGTARRLLERFPRLRLFNAYGPTEATSAVCGVQILPELLEEPGPLPVGRLADAACEITVSDGEIVLKGESVFSGYLDGSRGGYFRENGAACYRTGDLGRIEGGLLYCGGRKDRQIKWKGCRIELDGIEQAIQAVPGVRACAVVPKKTEANVVRLLVAYVVLEPPLDPAALRDSLAQSLPPYMIPKSIRAVDALPQTANGKTDRKRLEELE